MICETEEELFDPILEMIEAGKGIPPLPSSWVESPFNKDTFYCSNCGYNPDLENIDYINYCPNCGAKNKINILNEISEEIERAKNVPLYVKGLQKAYNIIIGDKKK